MKTKPAKIQPQYQVWLNLLCRNLVIRLRSVPEVTLVAVQPFNESGLPDFFVLLDDAQPAESSAARYRVTQAVLQLRSQYANPWLLDYYFLNLEDYRPENAQVSWREFISPTETIIYVRHAQPFDMRIARWGGAAAGMLGCALITLLVTVSNRTSPGNILSAGWQAILFMLPLLLIAGILTAGCTERCFAQASLWSNGEGVTSAWNEAMVESGLLVGSAVGLLITLPRMIGIKSDFLINFGTNLPNARASLAWYLPPPLNLIAYLHSAALLYLFSGLVIGLMCGFIISLATGWLVRRWAIANPLRPETPLTEARQTQALKYLALAVTFASLFFACYALWPLPGIYKAF